VRRTPEQIATELLVLKVQAGDQAAFAALYRQWGPVLISRCRRQLQQKEDAQDAAQKVWLKVMRNIGGLKDPACFAAWLLRIGHLTCIDTIRRKTRRGGLANDMQVDQPLTPEADDEASLDMRAAIGRLPAIQQEILKLRYASGFTMGEIAHILGIAVGTVKSRLHTARNNLRTQFETGENHE